MDYLHDRRPHASSHRDSYSREGRNVQANRQSSSYLAVDSHRHYHPSTHRSSSYSSPRPEREHSSRRARSQVRWPPSPSVESEASSTAREYRPLKCGEPSPPHRGSIDQDPLMIEVNPPKKPRVNASLRPESKDAYTSSQMRRGKSPAPPPIKTKLDALPDFVERRPRPYNGTGASDSKNKRISAEYLLSPQRTTPIRSASFAGDELRATALNSLRDSSPRVSPVRSQNTFPQVSQDRSSRSYYTDESDLDAKEVAKLRSRGRSSRYSFTKAELANQTTRRPITTESSDESMSDRVSKLRNNAYSQSSGSPRGSRPSTPTLSDSIRQPTQPPRTPPASALSYKQTASPTPESSGSIGSRQSYVSSSNPSQTSHGRYPYSPPHSPKLRPTVQGTASPLNAGSRAGSRQNSRPTTPQSMLSDAIPSVAMLDVVNQKLGSRSTYPPVQDSRTKNASRLSSDMKADSIPTPLAPRIDVQSPSPAPPARAPLPYPDLEIPKLPYPSLPYPDEQSPFVMPSETAFQFQHPSGMPEVPQAEHPRTAMLQRPALVQRHSCAEGVEQGKNDRLSSPLSPTKKSRPEPTRQSTFPTPTAPASCLRSKSSKGNNDWSTLTGDSNFNICPQCLQNTVNTTAFSDCFEPVQRDPNERIKCDFSRPWIRLAWLLTLKQQRPDLDLLYAVSSVSNFESECRGDEEQKRTWYGFISDDDEPIPDFYICSRDRRYIEALFPSLKPSIERISRSPHTCTMDRASAHFGSFLDALVSIDEKARRAKRLPDLHPFHELVQKVAIIKNMPKCPKDTLAKGSDWHYLPGLPEFTVCPRCFVECVAPHIRTATRASPVVASLPLADQFYRTAQPLARENGATRGMGSSCQLYSPRMRRIWASVVEDNDEKYLARKVRERKAVEMGVYETYATLEKMTAVPGYDRGAVKEELDRVRKEWKEVE